MLRYDPETKTKGSQSLDLTLVIVDMVFNLC